MASLASADTHRGRARSARVLGCLALVLLSGVALVGCGSNAGAQGAGAADAAPPAPAPYSNEPTDATCDEFTTWREAQDALDFAGGSEGLDPDGDGVACVDDLAQPEFEEGWDTGYSEACDWTFGQSSTGDLYDDTGTAYSAVDCTNADPGPDLWEADTASEPQEDGAAAGWNAACEEAFGTLAGYGDLQVSSEGIDLTQADCELASSYS